MKIDVWFHNFSKDCLTFTLFQIDYIKTSFGIRNFGITILNVVIDLEW